jgi:hypothetical protein
MLKRAEVNVSTVNIRRKRIVTLSVIIVIVVGLSFLFTNRKVRAVFDNAHYLYVLYRVENELLMSSPAGRYYRALFWKSNDELIRIAYQYPENNAVLFSVADTYMPAMEALVNGQGDKITLNAEQVAAAQAEFEWLASVAEPPLQQDIQGELARFQMQTFVGMTAQQAWDYINANWVPRTPEEQAMSELTTQSPPTPDYDAIKLEYTVDGNVGFFYPVGWELTSPDPGMDPANRTIFIDPPGADTSGRPSIDRITLHVWPLPAEEQGSLEAASSYPQESGYTVLWREDLLINDLHGTRYVWGKPGDNAILYARLYSETEQVAIQLFVRIKNPDDLKVFGYRYTLGTEYVAFERILSGIRVVSSPTETPMLTGTATFFAPSETSIYSVTNTPTP